MNRTLMDVSSYSEIIGLDHSDAGAATLANSFGDMPSVAFVQADASVLRSWIIPTLFSEIDDVVPSEQ